MTADARHLELNHADLCPHAEIAVKIYGNETSWIGGVRGAEQNPGIVSLHCKQLNLIGDIDALESVLADWSALLAEVRRRPEDWHRIDLRARRTPSGQVEPHPFTRRAEGGPPASGPSLGHR